MKKSTYTKKEIRDALHGIGIRAGDVVFGHSHIGFLGFPEGPRTPENAFQTILEAFLEVLGPEGTLTVPTFTYSFSNGKSFDPDQTPSDCGIFTEMFRRLPDCRRSEDPNISIAAIGKQAKYLTQKVPENAYGQDCFWERFYEQDGKICNINFDAGSTFVHWVERQMEVPYRFDKSFQGIFFKNGRQEIRRSTIWVRYLCAGTEAAFNTFDKLARYNNMYLVRPAGRGFFGMITARDTRELIQNTLPCRPWFLTKAETVGIIPDLKNPAGKTALITSPQTVSTGRDIIQTDLFDQRRQE